MKSALQKCGGLFSSPRIAANSRERADVDRNGFPQTAYCRFSWFLYACAAVMVFLAFPRNTATAGWNTSTGLKDNSDTATELADPWTGTQLTAQGGTLNFLGSVNVTGNVLLQEQSSWGSPLVTVAGSFTMNGPTLSVLDGATLQVTGNLDGTGNTTVAGNSTLTASRIVQNDLTLGDASHTGANVMINRSGGTPEGLDSQVSRVDSLSLANDGAAINPPPPGGYTAPLRTYFGLMDLVNNDMIIRNVSPSQVAEIIDMVRAGFYTGGASGITSSEALFTGDYAGLTYLGTVWNTYYTDINDPNSGVPIFSDFDGLPLVGGELIIKYTWFGDADLSGLVDSTDAAFYTTGDSDPNSVYNHWLFGDFDYSAQTNTIDASYYTTGFPNGNIIHLPEPSSLMLMLFAVAVGPLARRSRLRARKSGRS